MASEAQKNIKRIYLVILATLVVLVVLWIPFTIGRVLLGVAPWGPRIGGELPNGTEVYFQRYCQLLCSELFRRRVPG